MSSKWITDSVSAGTILPEESYEVAGNSKAKIEFAPRRSRLFHRNKDAAPLFSSVCALLFGHFPTPGPPKSDIEELLISGGVNVLCTSVEQFQQLLLSRPHVESEDAKQALSHELIVNRATPTRLFVVICSELAELTDLQQAFANAEKEDGHPAGTLKSESGIDAAFPPHSVRVTWVLDCITNFHLLSTADYAAFS